MISVILNVYKRPHMLERQIESVLNQTMPVLPVDIHVWYNEAGVDQPPPADQRIKTYRSNWNTKFHGRFMIPLICRNPYIAIFDDDNLPGKRWFENCINVINREETNGILGGTGVFVNGGREKIGWNGVHSDKTERVDFIGQTWFFRKEWAKYMWYEEPVCWDNGEDIMFCYLAQKYGDINTFVPPHPESDTDYWSTDYKTAWDQGRDKNASWRKGGHRRVRSEIYDECIKRGWKVLP